LQNLELEDLPAKTDLTLSLVDAIIADRILEESGPLGLGVALMQNNPKVMLQEGNSKIITLNYVLILITWNFFFLLIQSLHEI